MGNCLTPLTHQWSGPKWKPGAQVLGGGMNTTHTHNILTMPPPPPCKHGRGPKKSRKKNGSIPTPGSDNAVHARDTHHRKAHEGLKPYTARYNAQATEYCLSLFTVGGIRCRRIEPFPTFHLIMNHWTCLLFGAGF